MIFLFSCAGDDDDSCFESIFISQSSDLPLGNQSFIYLMNRCFESKGDISYDDDDDDGGSDDGGDDGDCVDSRYQVSTSDIDDSLDE